MFCRTVRVILVSPDDRLLLTKVDGSDGSPVWVTIGGALNEGEDPALAASREIIAETGRIDLAIGSTVWRGEQVVNVGGRSTRFFETFVFARCGGEGLSEDGWSSYDRASARTMKWWSCEALYASKEAFQPPSLPSLFATLLSHGAPADPIVIDLGA